MQILFESIFNFLFYRYEDEINLDDIEDEKERASLECQIVNFG